MEEVRIYLEEQQKALEQEKIIASLIVLFVFVVLTMSLLMIKRKLMSNLLEGKNKSMKPFPYSKRIISIFFRIEIIIQLIVFLIALVIIII